MKSFKQLLTSFFFLVLFTTCTKDKIAPIPYSTSFGVSSYAQAQEELKIYARWGVYTDGISELSLRSNSDIRTEGEIFHKYRATLNDERSNGGDFYIDEIKSTYREDLGRYISEVDSFSGDVFEFGDYLKNNIFGKDINFRLERGSETIYNQTIYLPAGIDLLDFPNDGILDNSTYHKISRDDFSLEWNGDENNENGNLAIILWDGNFSSTTLLELTETSGGYYQKAIWLEDTGHENIPTSFFEEVPEGAIFSLILMRGHIEIIRGTDEKTYKISGISEDKRSFVLMD